MNDIERLMRNYRMTTAEILYHLPDHPRILQSYTWQELDLAPEFPQLKRFLDFWEHSLDGKLHSIKIATRGIIAPTDYVYCKGELNIH